VKEVKSEVGLFIEVDEVAVRIVERSLSESVALDEGSILKQLTHLKSEEKPEGEDAVEEGS